MGIKVIKIQFKINNVIAVIINFKRNKPKKAKLSFTVMLVNADFFFFLSFFPLKKKKKKCMIFYQAKNRYKITPT